MRLLRLNLAIVLSFVVIFSSCEGLLDDESEQEGKYTFWSNFDGPPIDVYVNSNYYGFISTFYSSNPGCEADGCVTVSLRAGTYNFEAVEQANMNGAPREWSGTIEIKPGGCSTLGLSP